LDHAGEMVRSARDNLWEALPRPCEKDRRATANAALNAIYRALGEKRDLEWASAFEAAARERRGDLGGSPDIAPM
jgi:hypothetical protein